MKRYLLISVVTLAATLTLAAPVALAQGFTPIAPIPGLNDMSGVATEGGIAKFLGNLYIFCIGIAVVLAIIMIIWGGVEYAFSEVVTNKTEGRKKIVNALFGLVLVLSPVLVFTIINPAILNLNVNIPKLDTAWGKYVPPPGPDTSPVKRPTEEIDAGNPWCYYYGSPRKTDCKATQTSCIKAYFDRQAELSTTVGFIACQCDSQAALEGKCDTSF